MGKKDLKNQHKELVIDIIDILAELDPSKTNKFLTLLLKRFKEESSEFKKYVTSEITHIIGRENLRALKDFNEHLDKNRTSLKDVSLIKSFGDLHEQLVYAELKLKKRDLKKEISILHKDKEWLILKPLSYEASKIYGAGTKWCTSSREEDKAFYNYSNDGVLLYVIKLGTDEKFGVHWYFEKNKSIEMSWWDVEDRKVDSLTLDVPSKITQIILDHYCNVIPIDFGVRADIYDGPEPPPETRYAMEGTGNVSDTQWTLHDGNTNTTLNVEGLVNKTLEYSYMTQALKKSLEDLDD